MTTRDQPEPPDESITFSFGENWESFVKTLGAEAIARATQDLEEWVGRARIEGHTVVDIGCGSGLSSLCFLRLGAAQVVSFDVDPRSVRATKQLWQQAGEPARWRVSEGSILDGTFAGGLGQFDIVYSWGVLHHTGHLWEALDRASELLTPNGLLWVTLYTRTPEYAADLALKRRYNRAGALGKRLMVWRQIGKLMWDRLRSRRNPLAWNQRKARGMDTYHDLVDWLGGLPYEVASPEEIQSFCHRQGLRELRTWVRGRQMCSYYLLQKPLPEGTAPPPSQLAAKS